MRVKKILSQLAGIAIGAGALYFSVKNINSAELKSSLVAMRWSFILPIILLNFGVVAFKAVRWQYMLRPIKNVRFLTVLKVITIGFMANNILPARLGEVLRIHILGKNAEISRISTTASIVSDRILEAVSLLFLAAVLVIFTNVPRWLHYALIVTLLITVILYTLAVIYSGKELKNKYMIKFQHGIKALCDWRIFSMGLFMSFLSWFFQLVMIYMVQIAFNVHLPFWGTFIVIMAVNMAVAVPGAPAHVGTFEFACVLAYSFFGIDKSLGLLMGITYHLAQVIPITIAGGAIMLLDQVSSIRSAFLTKGQDTAC